MHLLGMLCTVLYYILWADSIVGILQSTSLCLTNVFFSGQ
jgi:hypothetical protein